MARILERIRKEGPLLARDIEKRAKRKPGVPTPTWFEWTPGKRALEQLFMEGKLLVRERRGFQKVFDLPERVLPDWVDRTAPTLLEHAKYLVRQTLRSHGIAQSEEMRYLRKSIRVELGVALNELKESGEICEVEIERIQLPKGEKFYAFSSTLSKLDVVQESGSDSSRPFRILSPFDSAVIQRKRLKLLFGFDYQIECYVPAIKRKHGYFCLPLLQGDRFVGRMDAKADRKSKRLEVHTLSLEPSYRGKAVVSSALSRELRRFARFNGCESVHIHAIVKRNAT